MLAIIKPDRQVRQLLSTAAHSQMDLCYTCQSCATECPVNSFTNRLHPVNLVRMANFGLIEELLESPEIWYCLSCNRCTNVCPMTVKPATLIAYLRWEAIHRGAVSPELSRRMRELHREFHHIRWHVASACLKEEDLPNLSEQWDTLANTPIPAIEEPPFSPDKQSEQVAFRKGSERYLGLPTQVKSCFTCGECSSVCPVCFDRNVFDPLLLFRLANLGIRDTVLTSPALWLCIGCQSCTQTCGQKVRGHLMIRQLQQMALEEGYVRESFLPKWQKAQEKLYHLLLDRVDALRRPPA